MGNGQAWSKIGLQDLLAIQGSWNLDSGDPRQLGPAKMQLTPPPLVFCAQQLQCQRAVFSPPATDMVRLLPASGRVPGGLVGQEWSRARAARGWDRASEHRHGLGQRVRVPVWESREQFRRQSREAKAELCWMLTPPHSGGWDGRDSSESCHGGGRQGLDARDARTGWGPSPRSWACSFTVSFTWSHLIAPRDSLTWLA